MVSPMAGTRAPTFQRQAGHVLLLHSELTKPQVTWLGSASAQHCPSGSCLIEKEASQGQPGTGAGRARPCALEGAWVMLTSGPKDRPLNVGSAEAPRTGVWAGRVPPPEGAERLLAITRDRHKMAPWSRSVAPGPSRWAVLQTGPHRLPQLPPDASPSVLVQGRPWAPWHKEAQLRLDPAARFPRVFR